METGHLEPFEDIPAGDNAILRATIVRSLEMRKVEGVPRVSQSDAMEDGALLFYHSGMVQNGP